MYDKKLPDCFEQSEIDWSNTVYLSPDSDQPLLDFDIRLKSSSENVHATCFVMGGLIDRTVVKNATLQNHATLTATEQVSKMQCRRLPIQEFFDSDTLSAKKELSLDQVALLLSEFKCAKALKNKAKLEPTEIEQVWRSVLAKVIP